MANILIHLANSGDSSYEATTKRMKKKSRCLHTTISLGLFIHTDHSAVFFLYSQFVAIHFSVWFYFLLCRIVKKCAADLQN